MPETYYSKFLKRFYILTQKVRLIWALCAVILIMFGLDFSPIMSSNVGVSPYEYTQALTAVPGSNLPVRSQSDVLNVADNSRLELAQATASGGDGQVKALSTITIPVSSILGTTTYCGLSLYTGGYGCYTVNIPPFGAGIATTTDYRFIGFTSSNKVAYAYFNTGAIPAGESIIRADLLIWYSSCGNMAYSVTGYPTVTGYATVLNCGAGVSLGTGGAAAIQAVRPYSYVLSFQGGTGHALFSAFQLNVTYGSRTVDLKANGSDGPITVAGGSTVNLNWDYTGFSQCSFGANPSWYTPQWPLGQNTLAGTGTASTKIYYESVTYNLNCRDPGSGATGADSVTVNVTP